MISTFSFPTRMVFGPGAIQDLRQYLAELKIRRPLIVTDPGLVGTEAFKKLEKISRGEWPVFSQVHPNPVIEDVEGAAAAYKSGKCDGVIAFGGGSALDVGKVFRMRLKRPEKTLAEFDPKADWNGLPSCVTIPTTAGTGSEVGRSSVITIANKKRVIFHPTLLANLVLLDPELTVGLPPKLTAATGADALTHCIESVTSPVYHPICDGIALEGICMVGEALCRAVETGSDLEARGRMQMAAMMGGIAFQKDLGATHSLAHPLSTICGLHHGTANALCLPFVMEFNAARKPGVYRRVGSALGLNRPGDKQTIEVIRSMFNQIGLSPGLKRYGVKEEQLEALTNQAIADSCHQTNPVPVTKEDLRALYEQAM